MDSDEWVPLVAFLVGYSWIVVTAVQVVCGRTPRWLRDLARTTAEFYLTMRLGGGDGEPQRPEEDPERQLRSVQITVVVGAVAFTAVLGFVAVSALLS